ncbi:flagellar motor switch phosphatase FliY [Planococcus halocryophilus]|uniref:flagellar motor switch phosphatase FliY n=1 Tax=Planococcus halocryophilus TaxID=1215089 RepID=UPI001F0E3DA9|nr:flagellar motor switch phosphatase FliY [Planococcus halocryophilus]MCH4827641.1 flagellar motor switch phosphatase FliY [Planococcus halocryophilus]
MTNNPNSLEEIASLLNQEETGGKTMPESSLSKTEKEAVIELLNTSFGSSAAELSTLLSEQVFVTSPTLTIKERDEIFASITAPCYVALGEYSGAADGMQILSVAKRELDIALATGQDITEEDTKFKAVQELIEQMFGAVAQSMSILMDKAMVHSLTGIDVINQSEDFSSANFTQEQWFTESEFQINVSSNQNIRMRLYLPVSFVKLLVSILNEPFDEEELETKEAGEMSKQSVSGSQLGEQDSEAPTVQNVQFSSFDNTDIAASEANNLNLLLDIPLQVTVELGRTKRMVKDILEISQGSIIELDKLAGEPVDILINNKLIAVGEVVVIDENFGVRVTDVLSTAERISKLR